MGIWVFGPTLRNAGPNKGGNLEDRLELVDVAGVVDKRIGHCAFVVLIQCQAAHAAHGDFGAGAASTPFWLNS